MNKRYAKIEVAKDRKKEFFDLLTLAYLASDKDEFQLLDEKEEEDGRKWCLLAVTNSILLGDLLLSNDILSYAAADVVEQVWDRPVSQNLLPEQIQARIVENSVKREQ